MVLGSSQQFIMLNTHYFIKLNKIIHKIIITSTNNIYICINTQNSNFDEEQIITNKSGSYVRKHSAKTLFKTCISQKKTKV